MYTTAARYPGVAVAHLLTPGGMAPLFSIRLVPPHGTWFAMLYASLTMLVVFTGWPVYAQPSASAAPASTLSTSAPPASMPAVRVAPTAGVGKPVVIPTTESLEAPLAAFDLYYGIYVGGQKVGWMHSTLAPGARTRLDLQLRAKVSGMGQASDITLDEHRTYEGPGKPLATLDFTQGAATGKVELKGHRRGDALEVSIAAGGAQQHLRLPVTETLADATALYRLGRGGQVGSTLHTHHFDASLQKDCAVVYTVAAEEIRVLAGVQTRTVKVTAHYPELSVDETSWVDGSGKVLESRIGGFFVARLEAPDVAKKLDYSQDLLVSAVVPAPWVLATPHDLTTLQLTFTGFADLVPPSSLRQVVQVEGEATKITLTRDAPPRTEVLGRAPAGDAGQLGAVREALLPTPFIQSTAPVLVKAARRAVGQAPDVFTASSRLQHFVYTYLHSEYVPAFSNALEAYNSRRGDCTEHSVLFVALARAVKIPARVAVGIAYWPPGNGFGWHAWAEIWIDGRWLAVDPTWNQPIADTTHVKLADGGPAEQARIVMLLGQLKITDMQTPPSPQSPPLLPQPSPLLLHPVPQLQQHEGG